MISFYCFLNAFFPTRLFFYSVGRTDTNTELQSPTLRKKQKTKNPLKEDFCSLSVLALRHNLVNVTEFEMCVYFGGFEGNSGVLSLARQEEPSQ